MLRIEGLTRRYGSKAAVENVSLDIESSKFIGVIGRSGAGKSTLLRMINRVETPTSGSIRFAEIEVTRLKGVALVNWRARCAMIFQQFNLVGRLDVLTNVLIGRMNHVSTLRSVLQPWSESDIALRALRALRARPARHRLARGPAGRQALRRAAAAGRDRPRARARAGHHPRRRADRLARSAQHAHRHGRAPAHQSASRHHGALQSAFARPRTRLLRPADRHGERTRRLRGAAAELTESAAQDLYGIEAKEAVGSAPVEAPAGATAPAAA